MDSNPPEQKKASNDPRRESFDHYIAEVGEEFETQDFELFAEPIRTDDGGFVALFDAAGRDEIFVIREYPETLVYQLYSKSEVSELGGDNFDRGILELLKIHSNHNPPEF